MSKVAASTAGEMRGPAEWGSTETTSSGAALTQFISFAIGDDQYGVAIMAVREIKGWSEVASLAGQPDYVRGVPAISAIVHELQRERGSTAGYVNSRGQAFGEGVKAQRPVTDKALAGFRQEAKQFDRG